MSDPRVIDLSHLNIADVRTIDLSHLGIPDAQPAAPGTSYGQGPLQKPARPIRDEAGNANALPDAKTTEISLSLIKGALAAPGPLTPAILPHSLSPKAIQQYREEYHNFLERIGALPEDRGAKVHAATQENDKPLVTQEGGAPAVGFYDAFRRRRLTELAPWQIEPTEFPDYMAAPTAPARSAKDWFERVLPSSLVKTIGAVTGITAARSVATTMAETGWEMAAGNMSPERATLEDLKAIAGLVPAAVKGAVKVLPGLNAHWRQAWATDPSGTALGLLAILGGVEGVSEGGPYLSRSAEAADLLTRKGIPADQVAETFKTIEKAQAAGGPLKLEKGGPVEAEYNGPHASESRQGQAVEEPEPGPIESTPRLYRLL